MWSVATFSVSPKDLAINIQAQQQNERANKCCSVEFPNFFFRPAVHSKHATNLRAIISPALYVDDICFFLNYQFSVTLVRKL